MNKSEVTTWACVIRNLIALHHGRKRKSESFASLGGRVNISCASENSRLSPQKVSLYD